MQPRGLVTSALLLALVGCENGGSKPATPSARPSATAVRSVPRPVAPAEPPPEVPRCRVISARPNPGKSDAGVPGPAVGTVLEGREWLELGAFEVVLRHASTTRELSLRGPGRFLPCFLGTETVLVSQGSVKTTAGAGARAGAEVVLATPFGTLHFADAALEARVAERELEVKVENGVVTLAEARGATSGKDAGASELVLGPKSKKRLSGDVDTKVLVESCSEASRPLSTTPPPSPSA